ncbi:hypothetical protein N0V94_006178 [Neodidymelliopsis sp. IMI 364377]|nr:hypothetical protein N0V94_006178 [Neodidymelliopsis sp. IMI 364377]
MRLLHFNDDDSLSLVEFLGNDIPPFAILSHTWYSDSEEYNFQDVVRGTGEERRGYQKVQFCGQQAKRDGLQYFWVDTCCIDKSSSAELTEAINSMFRWYQESEKCYVYLSDVMCYSNGPDDGANRWKSAFGGSKWFTRGWTLQELIAPRSVSFFSQEGQLLGDKCSLLQTLHEITGITFKALQGDSLSEFGVEERFAWAANRHTKREEDAVYSLLGIFSVYLPLIYGEGKDNALARLRREISGVPSKTNMEKEERAKIFAWLSAPDPSTNYNKALKQLLKGTGLWFLEGQEFAKWKTEDSSLLWLHGIPGSGKTILSSAIVQNLLDEDRIVGTSIKAYFFFDFKDTQKQDPDLMLRSLLSQMSQQCESMYTSLHTLYRSCEDGQRQPSTDALTRAIQRGVNKNRQAYIVFDALDECAQRTELMQMITTMIEWRFTGWHLLMTSRKEREIESYLEELLDCKNTLSLKSHLVNHDIRHYVQKRLSEDKTLRKWAEDQSIREEIEEALMEGAQGM